MFWGKIRSKYYLLQWWSGKVVALAIRRAMFPVGTLYNKRGLGEITRMVQKITYHF